MEQKQLRAGGRRRTMPNQKEERVGRRSLAPAAIAEAQVGWDETRVAPVAVGPSPSVCLKDQGPGKDVRCQWGGTLTLT
jgi:hypothetical protein